MMLCIREPTISAWEECKNNSPKLFSEHRDIVMEEKRTLKRWNTGYIGNQSKCISHDVLADSYTCTIKNHNEPDIMSNL